MKAIVVAQEKNRLIVLKKDGTFAAIPKRNCAIGQEIDLPISNHRPMLSTLAACLVLFCLSTFGISFYRTPCSYVYLDINPSLRLDVNFFGQVVSVVPLNEDAQNLLNVSSPEKGGIEACIREIVDACQEQAYLHRNNSDVEIGVMTHQNAFETKMHSLSDSLKEEAWLISLYSIDEEENRLALQKNLSGKELRALREYTAYFGGDPEKNLSELNDRTADELLEEIRSHRRSTPGKNLNAEESLPLQGKRSEPDEPAPNHQAQRRANAIQRYTEALGGNYEENEQKLVSCSISEIYALIRETLHGEKANRIP